MDPEKTQIAKVMLKKKTKSGGVTIQDSSYITKLYSSRQYGTGTKTDTLICGTENPEMYPQMYGQRIFDKEGNNTPWKKRKSLQQMVLGKLTQLAEEWTWTTFLHHTQK